MTQRHLYRDSGLSLTDLAADLGLTRKQTSALVNTAFGMSFRACLGFRSPPQTCSFAPILRLKKRHLAACSSGNWELPPASNWQMTGKSSVRSYDGATRSAPHASFDRKSNRRPCSAYLCSFRVMPPPRRPLSPPVWISTVLAGLVRSPGAHPLFPLLMISVSGTDSGCGRAPGRRGRSCP